MAAQDFPVPVIHLASTWYQSIHSRQESHNSYLQIMVIIHQTHHEKSDWSRAFNQSTIACELDIINAISAADIAFIMSSSKSGETEN